MADRRTGYFVLGFKRSTSGSFEESLARIKAEADSVSSAGSGMSETYSAEFSSADPQQMADLLSLVTRWKTTFTHGGTISLPTALARDLFRCQGARAASTGQSSYCEVTQYQLGESHPQAGCANPFGCHLFGPSEWPYWQFWQGEFLPDESAYLLDRDAIRQSYSAKAHDFMFCPYFPEERATRALDLMPEKIEPMKDTRWAFNLEVTRGGFIESVTAWWDGGQWRTFQDVGRSSVPNRTNVRGVTFVGGHQG